METRINQTNPAEENERFRWQLAELDELFNKKLAGEDISRLKGLQDIATGISKKIHAALPGRGDQSYLDLYFLRKERDRLVKEVASLKRRRLQLAIKLASIDREMVKRQEVTRTKVVMLATEGGEKPVTEEVRGKKRGTTERYEKREDKWNIVTLEY